MSSLRTCVRAAVRVQRLTSVLYTGTSHELLKHSKLSMIEVRVPRFTPELKFFSLNLFHLLNSLNNYCETDERVI